MERLPPELIEKILNLISIKDICSFSLLNQYWNIIGTRKLYYYPNIQTENALFQFANISIKSQFYIRVLNFKSVHPFVTDQVVSPLLKNVKNIKHLDLSKCIKLSSTNIHFIIENNMYHLDTLILSDCTLSTDILNCIGKSIHSKLKKLDLSNTMIKPCTAIDTCNPLEDMITSPFSTSQLTYLNLSYCSWVDDQTVKNIAYGLPKLETIILQWCKIKLGTLKMLIKNLHELKSIDIRHIDSIANTEQLSNMVEERTSSKRILFTSKRLTAQIILK